MRTSAFTVPGVTLVLLASLGCTIASKPGSGGGGGSTTVTVSPTSASVATGGTQNFTATVTGPQLTSVTWDVNGVQNGNATVGTISQGSCGTTLCAVYLAPQAVPTGGTASITAISVADGTKSSAVSVTITKSNVALTVSPKAATVDAGTTAMFTATVNGSTTNFGVNWLVNNIPNGDSSVGTIKATSAANVSTATYTAPATAPSVASAITITAQSVANTFASDSATATIPPIAVSVSPSTPSVGVGAQQQFAASVTGTTNSAVTWQVNGAAGGNATTGTIDASGLYTAPAMIPSTFTSGPYPVTITAVSQANTAYSGSAIASVHVTVSISPSSDTIGQGGNRQFSATVAGTTNQVVVWSENCANCTGSQTGGKFDVNNLGLYYAPGFGTGITSLVDTIIATSAFDQQQSGTAAMTVLATDPLGTATPSTAALAEISCPTFSAGLSGATCYQLTVSCDAVANYSVYLKVNTPAATPIGTVIFGTGEGGTTLYDNDPSFIVGGFNGGETVVQDVLNLNYTTVQVSFGGPFDSSASTNGWLQGPGGVRRLACRYATAADWVYKNIHNSSTTEPLCGTGHKEGSGALAYAISEYGLASEFSMVEHTSGPAMTRLNWGCSAFNSQFVGSDPCTGAQGLNMSYSVSGGADISASLIDAAYQTAGQSTPTLCTDGVNGSSTNFSRFLSDSILDDPGVSPALPIPNPPTNVNVVFGQLDTSDAVPYGYAWWGNVGPTPPKPVCSPNAGQAIPADSSTSGGAAQIVSDIQNMCKLH